MLFQKCLLDWRIALETCFRGLSGGLSPTISVTFQNQKKRHSHPLNAVIGQLCRDKKASRVWTFLSSSLFSFLTHNYFCHSSREELSATQWIPFKRDCQKMCTVIPIFIWYHIPFSLWRLFTSPFSVATQNNYKHFWFLTWLDNRLYELALFEHNPTLKCCRL